MVATSMTEKKRDTDVVRVKAHTRWALKIASAEIDCTIIELLARVEQGGPIGRTALKSWQDAARRVRKNDHK